MPHRPQHMADKKTVDMLTAETSLLSLNQFPLCPGQIKDSTDAEFFYILKIPHPTLLGFQTYCNLKIKSVYISSRSTLHLIVQRD